MISRKNNPQISQITQIRLKRFEALKENLCNLRNLWIVFTRDHTRLDLLLFRQKLRQLMRINVSAGHHTNYFPCAGLP